MLTLMLRLLTIACLLAFSSTSQAAEPIAGADDPAFRAAVTAWLDDDDATALPELSRLAKAGSTAARLLLGQIDREMPTGGETDFLKALSHKERKALFRAPGGLSGKSWIKSLADEGEPLAGALINANDPPALGKGLEQLMALGEPELAARKAANALNSGQYSLLAKIAGMPDFPENSRYLYWEAAFFGDNRIDNPEQIIAAIRNGDPRAYLFFRDVVMRRNLGFWDEDVIKIAEHLRYRIMDKDPEAQEGAARIIGMEAERAAYLAPAKAICGEICPGDVDMCMLELIQINVGYYEFINLDTPLENLIPQSDYLRSRRARQTLWRSTAWRLEDLGSRIPLNFSACLINTLIKP